MRISDFSVNKYKSSIFFVDSHDKSLGSVLFSRDGRVTANILFFALRRRPGRLAPGFSEYRLCKKTFFKGVSYLLLQNYNCKKVQRKKALNLSLEFVRAFSRLRQSTVKHSTCLLPGTSLLHLFFCHEQLLQNLINLIFISNSYTALLILEARPTLLGS